MTRRAGDYKQQYWREAEAAIHEARAFSAAIDATGCESDTEFEQFIEMVAHCDFLKRRAELAT